MFLSFRKNKQTSGGGEDGCLAGCHCGSLLVWIGVVVELHAGQVWRDERGTGTTCCNNSRSVFWGVRLSIAAPSVYGAMCEANRARFLSSVFFVVESFLKYGKHAGLNVPQAQGLLMSIIMTYPPGVEENHVSAVILWLQRRYDLIELLFCDMVRYQVICLLFCFVFVSIFHEENCRCRGCQDSSGPRCKHVCV